MWQPRIASAALILVGLCLVGAQNQRQVGVQRKGCGQHNPNGVNGATRIENNAKAQFGEFPWMVAVFREPNTYADQGSHHFVCGGSLIHPRAVLTAAHCVYGYNPDQLKIRAGEWDMSKRDETLPHQDRDVSNVTVHDQYRTKILYYDYAILILSEPVELVQNVDVVCLPKTDARYHIQSRCFASGWGKEAGAYGNEYPRVLKKVGVNLVPRTICQRSLRRTRLTSYFMLHQSFICAGGSSDEDMCDRDGGGPLVCPIEDDPTRFVQAGIVAWGIGCGQKNIPGVYADVANVRKWIDKQMAIYGLDSSVYQY